MEIAPVDPRTGRFLPVANVRGTILHADGGEIAGYEVPLMWHPWLYHYGKNIRVPHGSHRYTLVYSFCGRSCKRRSMKIERSKLVATNAALRTRMNAWARARIRQARVRGEQSFEGE